MTAGATAEVPIDLLASIYEAAVEPTSWNQVLPRLTAWVGGVAAGFNVRRSWPEVSTTQMWVGLQPRFEKAYAEHYFRFDPWIERAAALPEGKTIFSREILSDEELQRTAFFNEIVRPQGFSDLQGAMLIRDEHRMVTFGMFRPEGQAFDETTRTRLDALVPHLTRSLRLALSLDEHGDLGSAVAAATAARRLGVIRVDAALHVLGSFAGAEPWLAAGAGPLGIAGRRLTATDPGDLAALRDAVAAAIAGRSTNVVLGRGQGELVSVLVAPAPGASSIRPERSAHVLFAGTAEESRVDALRGAFGLTAAEARVAVKVGRGLPLRRIASDLGVSYHTVRAHIRQCFAKTGARRQSALAAMVHDSA